MPPKWNPDGEDWVDFGLGGFLQEAGFDPDVYEPELGKFKVPTLRNVDKRPTPGFVKAYGHNGYFRSLEEIVHFYNTRDVEMWPPPEVDINVNVDELGDLNLTADEEAAIVAFMKTLTDGYHSRTTSPARIQLNDDAALIRGPSATPVRRDDGHAEIPRQHPASLDGGAPRVAEDATGCTRFEAFSKADPGAVLIACIRSRQRRVTACDSSLPSQCSPGRWRCASEPRCVS